MVNYENGKIYKLEADGLIYIGSTTKKYLCQRLEAHYSDFKRYQKDIKKIKKKFLSSFELFQNEKPVITLIELVPCKSKDELLMRERFHIENTNCVNKIKRVILTSEEKREYKLETDKNIMKRIKKYF